jgi:membrane associated rhomboid family serine protease
MSQTNNLIVICVLVSLFVWTGSPQTTALLSFSTMNLEAGRIWTLITTLFVHASLIHLVGNMLFLYVFGNTLENVVGGRNTLATFLTGGVATLLFGIPFYPSNVPLVGASAAIFTLAATAMLVKPLKFSWLFLFLPVGLVAIIYFVYNVFAVYNGLSGGVAYISHVIGFLIGIPFGVGWSPRWARNLLITLSLLATYVIIIVFVAPIILDVLKKVLANVPTS